MTLNELCQKAHDNSVKHGFWEGQGREAIPEKLMLIVSEVAEALECYRSHEEDLWYDYPTYGEHAPKPCGIASELADVVIRVCDLAQRLGIDLDKAVEDKHAYNLTRPYKHGGKAC